MPTITTDYHCPRSTIEFQEDGQKLHMIIKTERLMIRSILPEDTDFVAKQLYGNPAVMRLVSLRKTKELTYVEKKMNTCWRTRWDNHVPFSQYLITLKTGERVGTIMLRIPKPPSPEYQPGTSELAFLIAPEYQRKGYATEAGWTFVNELAPLLMKKGYRIPIFDREGNQVGQAPFYRLMATAWEANEHSVKTLRKIGMAQQKTRMSTAGCSIQEPVVPFVLNLTP